ncbi:MAG: S9 family peptidase, partial [Caulobacter sp.]|nr:S9 family peptidase [Caulobacter sp.]
MLKFITAAAVAILTTASGANAASIEAYGRLPALENVEISPDGSALAAIVANGDQRQIIVRSTSGQVLAQAAIGYRKVRSVQWADNGHLLILSSSTTGIDDTTYVEEQWQAVSLAVATGAVTQLPGRSTENVLNTIHGRLQPGYEGSRLVVYTPLYVTVAGNMQRGSGHLDLFK